MDRSIIGTGLQGLFKFSPRLLKVALHRSHHSQIIVSARIVRISPGKAQKQVFSFRYPLVTPEPDTVIQFVVEGRGGRLPRVVRGRRLEIRRDRSNRILRSEEQKIHPRADQHTEHQDQQIAPNPGM